jgi:hypothetical protein
VVLAVPRFFGSAAGCCGPHSPRPVAAPRAWPTTWTPGETATQPPGEFCSVRIDGPKPNRLPVMEIRSPLDEKPTEDAEPAMGVLDERETYTATSPARQRKTPIRSPLASLRGAFLAEGQSMGIQAPRGRTDEADRCQIKAISARLDPKP